MKWTLPVLLMLILCCQPVFGQSPQIDSTILDSEQPQVLQTIRGDIFFGKTLSITADSVRFRIQGLDSFGFGREEVRWLGLAQNAGWLKDEVDLPSGVEDLENFYWPENLAYSMTAFPYPRRATEYRNISILYNTVDAGLSDNFSIGGGLVVPFLFILRSKVAYKLGGSFHLGAGLTNFLGTTVDSEGIVSHLFAIGTFGSPQQYINITAGPAYQWGFPEDSPFITTLGGGISFAPNWKVYADVGFAPGEDGIIPTILVSWFKKKNRLEFGVLGIADGFISAIPLIGYAHRF
jgi:hypothetical protein